MNDIPKKLLQIAEDIRSAGGRAFLVGGFVRDSLLGINSEARDFDIEIYSIDQKKSSPYEGLTPFKSHLRNSSSMRSLDKSLRESVLQSSMVSLAALSSKRAAN
jgi:tRNA nucleotidyltransferase/poly(A) polymerase